MALRLAKYGASLSKSCNLSARTRENDILDPGRGQSGLKTVRLGSFTERQEDGRREASEIDGQRLHPDKNQPGPDGWWSTLGRRAYHLVIPCFHRRHEGWGVPRCSLCIVPRLPVHKAWP